MAGAKEGAALVAWAPAASVIRFVAETTFWLVIVTPLVTTTLLEMPFVTTTLLEIPFVTTTLLEMPFVTTTLFDMLLGTFVITTLLVVVPVPENTPTH